MEQARMITTLEVPGTLEQALDPAWLTAALAPESGGRAVEAVETVEVIRTVATKVRFTARFAGNDQPGAYCLKGLLNVDEITARGGPTMVREADFYGLVGPRVGVRTPTCVATVIRREDPQGVVIMRDLIAEGARFCSALEPFDADQAAASLAQVAALHAGGDLLASEPWITPRVGELAEMRYITADQLQELLDGPRSEGLSPATRSAERLGTAMRALAERDAARPQFLVHGDAHAGNIFRNADGETGLIDWQLLQRGGWALDVAYHLCAVLPVELAAAEERRLLGHYLELMRGHGCAVPDAEEAWRQYREAAIYGFFLWSITRRVDPPIIVQFTQRLGQAVERHESHALLGVA
jgi:hypothetical protein